MIEQALCQIEGARAELLPHRRACERELVHADAVIRGRQQRGDAELAQAREEVVGVQDGDLRRIAQTGGAERAA